MGKFLDYNPDQAYLLPPSVRDVLGEGHLCFFLRVWWETQSERVSRRIWGGRRAGLRAGDADFGLAVRVCAGGHCLATVGAAHSRRLGISLFGGGAAPDHWTLNDFRRRHAKGLNDLFTHVVELARASGMGSWAMWPSTRRALRPTPRGIASTPSKRCARSGHGIRRDIRRWQKQCDEEDPNEGAGNEVGREVIAQLERQEEEIPVRLERLRKSGLKKLSRTDPDSRFLRERGGFTLGYTGTLAVSEDHLIVGQCVTQETNDNGLLLPLLDLVEQSCGKRSRSVPVRIVDFFQWIIYEPLERKIGIEGYVPNFHLARWLNRGGRLRTRSNEPPYRRMRRKLRDPAGRAIYAKRKAIVEPVNGVLKEQRGMRRFRQRGLAKVRGEWALSNTAYNVTRLWRTS